MKELIHDSFKKLISDRYLFSLLISLLLLAVFFAIIIGLSVHPRDLRLPSHYSAFGITHFYFNQWFYLLTFVAFSIISAFLHSLISVKILICHSRSMAIAFAWSGVGVVFLTLFTALSVLNIQKLL